MGRLSKLAEALEPRIEEPDLVALLLERVEAQSQQIAVLQAELKALTFPEIPVPKDYSTAIDDLGRRVDGLMSSQMAMQASVDKIEMPTMPDISIPQQINYGGQLRNIEIRLAALEQPREFTVEIDRHGGFGRITGATIRQNG